MTLSFLEQAIVYTLAYTTQFKFPLTPAEVSNRLIFKIDQDVLLRQPPTPSQITTAIRSLIKKKIIIKIGSYLTLAGFEFTTEVRDHRQATTAAKQPELMDVVALMSHCPWVELVYLTGSMAMSNSDLTDDIDFLIVTQPQRLWLTRLWILWQAIRRGKRRSWQGEEQGSWCFNLWLEVDQLGIFKDTASIYTAYELLQAQPIFARKLAPTLLLQTNQWAKDWLPLSSKWREIQVDTDLSLATKQSLWSRLLDGLNFLAYSVQLRYMKPHMTREKVSQSYAFFHPRDTQAWIYQGWQQVLMKVRAAL